ncbi:MAG: hypothetical protein E7200_08975 [Selenomonas ruminantium]|nr:hypothetical protein [Selenomonas ruminantium]
MKEWLSALKVAKDIVRGGISAYKAGEMVDALIAKSVGDYDAVLTENERDLYEQYKNATDEDKKANLRLAYLDSLEDNLSLPENFRMEVKDKAREYRNAENFALESMENTMMEYADTEEDKSIIKNTVSDLKLK